MKYTERDACVCGQSQNPVCLSGMVCARALPALVRWRKRNWKFSHPQLYRHIGSLKAACAKGTKQNKMESTRNKKRNSVLATHGKLF